MEWDDESPYCPECHGILCEHGACEQDCRMDCDCDCFDEPMTLSDIVRRSLDDQEPTHAFKFPVYRP